MATLSSKLILSLVDRVSAPARAISATVSRLSAQQAVNSAKMNAMRGQMFGAAAAGYAMATAIAAPIKSAVAFESAMADVKKVVDFPTPQAFKSMGRDIIELSTHLPMTANGIAEIVAAAGQAGMNGDELMSFAQLAAKVGVAFDMTAGQTGESLAKIKTSLQLTVPQTQALADAMNHLSNTSASSAPDLINYMKRVGAVGKQYGFSAEQTAALGSAMIASGAEANVAATSFRNVGKALTRGESASKRQRKAYKALGLDASKTAKKMQKDATGTLRAVMVKIGEMPKHIQASLISDLFGDEARAIAPLINNLKLMDDALGSVAQQSNYLGSSQKEYEARAATTANAMVLFGNKMKAASIAIGEALLPALNNVMDVLGPYLLAIADLARAHPELTSTIVSVAAGLVALRIASLAAQFSFLWMKGGLLSAAIFGLSGIGRAASISGAALKGLAVVGLAPFRLIAAAAGKARFALIGFAAAARIGGVGSAIGMALRGGTAALLGLLNPLKLVTVAMRVLKIAVIGTGIGAILIAIAAAGTAIYNNWSGIKSMFSGFGSAFMTAIDPIKPALDPVISLVKKLGSIWESFTGKLKMSDADWHVMGRSAGAALGNAVTTIKSKFDDLVKWFAGLPGRIMGAIGKLDISSLISWPKPPNWISKWFSSGPPKVPASPAAANDNVAADAPDKVRNSMAAVVGAVKSGGERAAAASKAAGIAVAVGLTVTAAPQIDTSSIDLAAAKISALKASLRSMPGANVSSGIAGARAAGGAIASGKTYLVGEEGPELVTASKNGYVHNASDTFGMLSGRGPQSQTASRSGALSAKITMNVNISNSFSGSQNEEDFADNAVSVLTEKLEDALSGIQSDIEWT